MTDESKKSAFHWFLNMLFSLNEDVINDIREHPEKLPEYCAKYGYQY